MDEKITTLPDKDLFRPDEVAAYFSVSVKTIYRWIDEGRLDAIKIGEKTLRIPHEAIKTLKKDISA